MAQERKRRRFTAEYKAEAVKRLEESGKALQQVAAELGVHANQLRTWRNERLAAGSAEALARLRGDRRDLLRGLELAGGGARPARLDHPPRVGETGHQLRPLVLPRDLDLDALSDAELQEIVLSHNLTPRKCLGFLTPLQALLKELGRDVQIRFA